MKSVLMIAAVVALFAERGHAEPCFGVLELSKVVHTTLSNSETVERHAKNFCSQYSREATSSFGNSFGVSFKFLAASLGNSSASAETVASKYCELTDDGFSAKDAYQEYVDNIAPGAFEAYQACLRIAGTDVQYSIDRNSISPTEFLLSASFANKHGGPTAALEVAASSGIECKWSSSAANSVELKSPSSAILKCGRDTFGRIGNVRIVRTDIADQEPLSLRWPAFNPEGYPMETLTSFQYRVTDVESRLARAELKLQNTGKILTIGNNHFSKRPYSAFEVESTPYNTLLDKNPHDSNVAVPFSGTYIATASAHVCVGGSSNYISAGIYLNGKGIAGNDNLAKECGSAVSTIALQATAGDVISGKCSVNQESVSGTCWLSLAYVGGP